MTVLTPELLVFKHLKSHFSDKIVEKFCKEFNFSPPEKNAQVEVSLKEILNFQNESEKPVKKRKMEEDTDGGFSFKKPKMDLSSTECYGCGKTGHMSRECPEKSGKSDLSSVECFGCGKTGHKSRDCPEKSGGNKMDLSTVECFGCRKTGHMSRECPEKSTGAGGDSVCFNCNKPGHFSRECPEQSKKQSGLFCYNCGQTGHFSRECPDKAGGMKCYNCNQTGHLSKECTEKNGANSKMLCFNCNTVGHMARDCDQPRVERFDGRGGAKSSGFRQQNRPARNFGSGANNQPLGPRKTAGPEFD